MNEIPLQNDTSDAKRFASHITELAERSLRDQHPCWTDFLEPPEREQAQAVLSWTIGIRFNAMGGYSQAERRRLVIYPDFYFAETIQPELAFLEIATNSPAPQNHRDFLGSLMSLGLKREKIGDLLVSDKGCQVIIVPELVDFIKTSFEKVGNSKATIIEIDPEQLNLPNQREKEIRATVASLRLDAIAALGFSDSRTKMAREIKALRVKVNWKIVKDPDLAVNPGDIISVRGRGRVIFRELSGRSKKGRLGIILVRLL